MTKLQVATMDLASTRDARTRPLAISTSLPASTMDPVHTLAVRMQRPAILMGPQDAMMGLAPTLVAWTKEPSTMMRLPGARMGAASMKGAPTTSHAITTPLPAWTTVHANSERVQGAQILRLATSIQLLQMMTGRAPTVCVVAPYHMLVTTMRKPLPMTVRATSSHVTCISSLNSITAGKKDGLDQRKHSAMQNIVLGL